MQDTIIILQRILPHYRVGFFEKFCNRFPNTKILFGQPYKIESLQNAKNLDKKLFIKTKNFYLNKNGKIFFSGIYFKIFKYRPKVIISVFNVGNINIYIVFFLKLIFRYKLILWSFGYDPVKGFDPNKRFTDKMRLYLSEKADAVIFYWDNGRKEVSKYSKRNYHFFVAPNTLDTEKLFQLKSKFDIIGKEQIKKSLDIKNEFHFIYVGRLLMDKQIDLLLKAFSILQEKKDNCGLSIIGDGPQLLELQELSVKLKLKNINFLGEILDEETTGKWIYVSEAFVIPGRIGLSAVHSFSYGTPIISQKKEKYFHGEGIGYVKNGLNGYLVKDQEIKQLTEKMIDIISDPELSCRLRINSFYTAQNECAIERMISGFESALLYVIENKIPI